MYQFYRDNSIKCRTEIYKENTDICGAGFQVLEDGMHTEGHCIIYTSVGSVGKLMGVKDNAGQVFTYKALKNFHND